MKTTPDNNFTRSTSPVVDSPAVEVGCTVRSYDFQDTDLWYKEGQVVAITDPSKHPNFRSCARYVIVVTTNCREGGREPAKVGSVVYPPVNGTLTTFGLYTRGVRVL